MGACRGRLTPAWRRTTGSGTGTGFDAVDQTAVGAAQVVPVVLAGSESDREGLTRQGVGAARAVGRRWRRRVGEARELALKLRPQLGIRPPVLVSLATVLADEPLDHEVTRLLMTEPGLVAAVVHDAEGQIALLAGGAAVTDLAGGVRIGPGRGALRLAHEQKKRHVVLRVGCGKITEIAAESNVLS